MLQKKLTDSGFQLAADIQSDVVQHPNFGRIVFSELTVDGAENLVNCGYTGLVKVEKKPVEKVVAEKSDVLNSKSKTQNPKSEDVHA
jgi:hypothetical protein